MHTKYAQIKLFKMKIFKKNKNLIFWIFFISFSLLFFSLLFFSKSIFLKDTDVNAQFIKSIRKLKGKSKKETIKRISEIVVKFYSDSKHVSRINISSRISKNGILNFILVMPWSEVSEKKIKRRIFVIKNLVKSMFDQSDYENTKFKITVYKLKKNFVEKDLIYKLSFE